MQRDIVQKWELKQAPELVWEYLTTQELIAQWLMQNDFKPVVGHKFTFKTMALPAFGFDGIVYCEVLEIVPMKKLVYSWKGGNKGKINLDSTVTWTLTRKGAGTELLLEHKGFKGLKNYIAYVSMNSGWGSKIKNKFAELLNNHRHAAGND